MIIKHAICPECGSTYVSGGETTTVTKKTVSNDGEPINDVNSEDPLNKLDEDDEIYGEFGKTERSERDERFDVGLYDREAEHGQLLNIVA